MALLGASLASLGCLPVLENTRVERGELLRTQTRSTLLPGGSRARVDAAWPQLRVHVQSFDLCRSELVETYAEIKTTEYSSPAAGPAFWVGTTGLLGGVALFGASYLLSDAPGRDELGRAGPSERQVARGVAVGALIVGAPAATMALAAMARVGERVEPQTGEQVASQRDEACKDRPGVGTLELHGDDGLAARAAIVNGAATLSAEQLSGAIDRLLVDGQPVALDETSLSNLDAFSACRERETWPAAEPASLGTELLLQRGQALHRCRRIRASPVTEEFSAIDRELRRRQAPVESGTGTPGPALQGGAAPPSADWDETVAKLGAPIQLGPADGSAWGGDLARRLTGRLVLLAGVLGPAADGAPRRLDVGPARVSLDLSRAVLVGTDASDGARVQVLGLVASSDGATQALPVVQVLFVRPAP